VSGVVVWSAPQSSAHREQLGVSCSARYSAALRIQSAECGSRVVVANQPLSWARTVSASRNSARTFESGAGRQRSSKAAWLAHSNASGNSLSLRATRRRGHDTGSNLNGSGYGNQRFNLRRAFPHLREAGGKSYRVVRSVEVTRSSCCAETLLAQSRRHS
jgi:hypothetical protein